MHKKYQFIAILFLMMIHNCFAMELVVQKQQREQKIPYEKKLNILCAQSFHVLHKFPKSIERVIQKQNNKNVEHKEYIETVLRVGNNLPVELQRKIFSYVFETEIPEYFLKNQNITSILHIYADEKDFEKLYRDKWLVINSRNCLKMGICQECIMFNYDHFLALPVDEKLLLGKIIKNNTVIIGNDITQLSEGQIYNIPSPYKITLAELPVAQKILKKQIECDVYILYTDNDPVIKNKEDLAKQLKIDIEYDGPTIKDKILVIIPLLMNSALPHMMLYGIDYGIELLVPGSGWLNWGVTIMGRSLGFVVSIITNGFIGDYIFPEFDKYNSGVVQLKKFFGDKVRMKIKRGGDGGLSFLFAIMENYIIHYSFLPLQFFGYIIRGLRLFFFNYFLYKSFLVKNPIDRRAPGKRPEWGARYVLRHMEKEDKN